MRRLLLILGLALVAMASALSAIAGAAPNGWDMNASNTGPAGALTAKTPSQLPGVTCSGSRCNVTVAGTTISNVDINGDLGILASNVTLSNCRIHGEVRIGRSIGGGGDTNVSNTRITHCELTGGGTYEGINVVGSTNGLWDFNNIHGYENSITEWTGTKDSIVNNYIWGDSNAQSGGHIDGLEIYGVKQGMTITGNSVVMTQSSNATAPLNLTPTGHFDGTITVSNNVFGSVNCGYVILGDDSQGSTPIIATINSNRLTRAGSGCGYFSLRHNRAGSTYALSGNVDGVTGALLSGQSPAPPPPPPSDRDGDGVPDSSDQCPDTPGTQPNGCPPPTPPPSGVCDQVCVDAYNAQLAVLAADRDAQKQRADDAESLAAQRLDTIHAKDAAITALQARIDGAMRALDGP